MSEDTMDQKNGGIVKNWYTILLFILIYGVYVFAIFTTDKDNDNKVKQNQNIVEDSSLFVVREYEELQNDGSMVTIQVWNDRLESIKR
jgi:hypothetical protein